MNIAILGATSFIAQELVREWGSLNKVACIHLYARNIDSVELFCSTIKSGVTVLQGKTLDCFPDGVIYDAVINCIGVGDPAKAKMMSNQIMDITFQYDDMVLHYLEQHPQCKYIFLSSGAAYGSDFERPASINKKASFEINSLQETETYGLAKFITEMKHRCKPNLSIVDVRVFNIFSKNQNVASKFFITDMLRAIQNSTSCDVSPEPMVRDYLHPKDFCQIIECILAAGALNMAVDCYSKAPVDKSTLLNALQASYGLQWRYTSDASIVRATGTKCNYYSENHSLERLGYKPEYSSLDTILTEFDKALSLSAS